MMAVEWLRWRMARWSEPVPVMATTGARRCGGCLRAKEAEAKRKWSAAGVGRTLAVMKACPGALWPARTECWRRAAIAGDTRRADSAGVGH